MKSTYYDARVLREFTLFAQSPLQNIKILSRSSKDALLYEITGPEGTAFEGNSYIAVLRYPLSYPYKAPTVQFVSPIFHPNISKKGLVCMDILQKQWSLSLTAEKVMLSVLSLLDDPNTQEPFNREAAYCLLTDKSEYLRINRKMGQAAQLSSIILNTKDQTWTPVARANIKDAPSS